MTSKLDKSKSDAKDDAPSTPIDTTTIQGTVIPVEDILDEKGQALFRPLCEPLPEPEEPIETERGKYSPRNVMNNLTGTEWIKFTRSWFIHRPPPRSKDEILHPAKFPEDLIEKYLRFFTKQGDWVLDPFCGTGSTLVACDSAKRNGIGVELTDKWAGIAKERTSQYIVLGDSKRIPEMYLPLLDFCISSPPYWDMLWHSRGGSESTQKDRIAQGFDAAFSEHEEDIGNIKDYDDFKTSLLGIYGGILDKLKPGGYCVVFLQNIQKQKQQFFPLAWEFALEMRNFGWQLCQEMIWCQRDKKLGIWGYPNTYISNVHHHYALVFRNPKK